LIFSDGKLKKKARIPYLLGGLFLIGSFVFNVYVVISVFELKDRVEEFYQKDFVSVRIVSEQLVKDIEKEYSRELPPIELNIRISEYSKTGIMYDGKILRLFLPPEIIVFDINQKRAYLAHEFGHYVLGHLDSQNPSTYSFFGTGDLLRDIEADSFVLRFSRTEDVSSVIKKLVWDDKEKKTRLDALGIN
jgi:hypothetical protein